MSEKCEICKAEVFHAADCKVCANDDCALGHAIDENAFDRIQKALALLKRVESGEVWACMVSPEYVQGRGQWERPDHKGYTMDWQQAGRFSKEEAMRNEAMSHGKYIAVPLFDKGVEK